MLTAEAAAREERRIRTSLKLSGLPYGIILASFDFAFQPAVERRKIETLATAQWIRDRQALLLLGSPGVGKIHLAAGLGVAAIERGLSVVFYRIEELLYDLRRDARMPPAHLKRRKYMNSALLIVDEVGIEPFSHEDANLFFHLVSYRYQRGAILITSNKSIRDWPEMLAGDETIAAANLDRLLHACHALNIKGRSYRLRDLDDQLGRGTDPFNPGDYAATPTSVNPIRESSGSLTSGRFGCVDRSPATTTSTSIRRGNSASSSTSSTATTPSPSTAPIS